MAASFKFQEGTANLFKAATSEGSSMRSGLAASLPRATEGPGSSSSSQVSKRSSSSIVTSDFSPLQSLKRRKVLSEYSNNFSLFQNLNDRYIDCQSDAMKVKAENRRLQSELDALRVKFDTQNDQMDREMLHVKSRLNEALQDKGSCENCDKFGKVIDDARRRLQEKDELIEKLQEENQNQEEKQKYEETHLNDQISTLQEQVTGYQYQLQAVHARLPSSIIGNDVARQAVMLQGKIDELEHTVNEFREQVANIQNTNGELMKKNEKTTRLEQEVLTLRETVNNYEQKIHELSCNSNGKVTEALRDSLSNKHEIERKYFLLEDEMKGIGKKLQNQTLLQHSLHSAHEENKKLKERNEELLKENVHVRAHSNDGDYWISALSRVLPNIENAEDVLVKVEEIQSEKIRLANEKNSLAMEKNKLESALEGLTDDNNREHHKNAASREKLKSVQQRVHEFKKRYKDCRERLVRYREYVVHYRKESGEDENMSDLEEEFIDDDGDDVDDDDDVELYEDDRSGEERYSDSDGNNDSDESDRNDSDGSDGNDSDDRSGSNDEVDRSRSGSEYSSDEDQDSDDFHPRHPYQHQHQHAAGDSSRFSAVDLTSSPESLGAGGHPPPPPAQPGFNFDGDDSDVEVIN